MQLPIMQKTKLIAGHQGVDKTIKWATVVEVIEDIERIQDGEFLITTGFNLLEDKKRMDTFHSLLRSRPLSAVAIYTSFYMEKIPDSFVQIANENYLPLIEIPVDINFSEITKEILASIVNKQTKLLEQAEKVHRELMSLILNDRSLSEITGRLAQLTNSNIFIFNEFYELIYNNQSFNKEQLTNVLEFNEKIDIKRYLLCSLENESVEYITMKDKMYTIYPIIAKKSCFGWIMMEKQSTIRNELDKVAIERATSIYAMEFIKRQAIEETKLRIQTGLLDDIFNRNYPDEQFIIEQAAKLDYDLTLPQSVFHLTLTSYSEIDIQKVDQLYYITEHLLMKKNKQYIVQTRLQSIVFLTNVLGNNKDEYDHYVLQLAKDISEEWNLYNPDEKIVIGIGNTYQSVERLSKSAEEALYAAQLRELNKENQYIVHYPDLGMYDLLLKMSKKGINLSSIYENNIQPLFNEPSREVDLIHTLTTFFEQNQSIKKTAEKLFIHRHTLRYRLNQIEIKTGLSLKETDDIVQLQFGLKAFQLNQLLKKKNLAKEINLRLTD